MGSVVHDQALDDTYLKPGLYLVPDGPAASRALELPQNRIHRDKVKLALLRRPKRTYDCLVLSTDRTPNETHFSIGSTDIWDLCFPLEHADDEFSILLEWAITQEDGLDEPRLYCVARATAPMQVFIKDEMTGHSLEPLTTERKCLSGLSRLVVGPYEFDIYQTVTSPAHRQELRKVCRQLTSTSNREDWQVIKEHVGRGSHGSVCLERSRQNGALVATKQIRLPRNDQTVRAKVEREVTNLKSLHHRYIIPYVHHEEAAEGLKLRMHPAHGSLHDLLSHARAKQSWRCIKVMFVQMTLAIQYLHKNGLVHRDVKPENILFRVPDAGELGRLEDAVAQRDLVFFLADFGVARHLATMNGSLTGTWGYMAPEVLHGQLEGYTSAVDIFAFGVVVAISLGIGDIESFLAGLTMPAATMTWEDKMQNWRQALREDVARHVYHRKVWLLVLEMVHEEHAQRPTASKVLEKLQSMWPDLVRNMVDDAEQYRHTRTPTFAEHSHSPTREDKSMSDDMMAVLTQMERVRVRRRARFEETDRRSSHLLPVHDQTPQSLSVATDMPAGDAPHDDAIGTSGPGETTSSPLDSELVPQFQGAGDRFEVDAASPVRALASPVNGRNWPLRNDDHHVQVLESFAPATPEARYAEDLGIPQVVSPGHRILLSKPSSLPELNWKGMMSELDPMPELDIRRMFPDTLNGMSPKGGRRGYRALIPWMARKPPTFRLLTEGLAGKDSKHSHHLDRSALSPQTASPLSPAARFMRGFKGFFHRE